MSPQQTLMTSGFGFCALVLLVPGIVAYRAGALTIRVVTSLAIGMATLALFGWLWLRPTPPSESDKNTFWLVFIALVLIDPIWDAVRAIKRRVLKRRRLAEPEQP